MTDNALNLITLNAIAVWLIQLAKNSKWMPFITEESEKVNKLASAVISAIAAAGMTLSIVHVGSHEAGTFTISYAGFTSGNIVNFLYHTIGYYVCQKGIFKAFFSNGNGKSSQPIPDPVPTVPVTKAA